MPISENAVDNMKISRASKVRLKHKIRDGNAAVEAIGNLIDGKAPAIGHNKPGGVAVEHLKSIVERIERLEEEKAAISEDIKEVFAEAKGNGFDTKIIKKVIKLRQQDAHERDEEAALLYTYCNALGMQMSLFDDESEAA